MFITSKAWGSGTLMHYQEQYKFIDFPGGLFGNMYPKFK